LKPWEAGYRPEPIEDHPDHVYRFEWVHESLPADHTYRDAWTHAPSHNALISYFASAINKSPSKEITIEEFIRIIRQEDFANGVAFVRQAGAEVEKARGILAGAVTEIEVKEGKEAVKELEKAKDAAKLKLPAVQISGRTVSGNRAQAIQEGRFAHSGSLQLDIDGTAALGGKTPSEARELLGKDPHVLAAFITPSGEGAKAIFRIKPCLTDEEHKQAWRAAETYIAATYGMKLDPATKDPGRLCFIPADKDCTWNDTPLVFVVPEQPAEAAKDPTKRKAPDGKQFCTSKGFPPPPGPTDHGIHQWLPQAAWWCRWRGGMTAAQTVEKLESYDGTGYRAFKENEVADAVSFVFSSPKQSTTSFDPVDQEASDLDLTGFTNTDTGNADRVHAYDGSNFRYVRESGRWLIWDGQRWNPDNDGGMVRLFVRVMRETGKQAFKKTDHEAAKAVAKHALASLDTREVNAGLQMLKSVLGVTVSINDLDADPWMIGTPDGMIDLKTGKPITPERDQLITKQIGTRYDATATCPTWDKFLQTVTGGDAELIQFLQAAAGYTLTGSNREQCLFFLYGSGQNGKGTFSETIKHLIGDYGQTAPESIFTKDRNQSATNDVARLSGCRMAIAAELEEGAHFAESRVKALTGGDTITARFLHKEYFDFQPTHHFWISGNHRPRITGTDLGIWRRIRLIPFTVHIPDAGKDLNLASKLRVELPGILNWALEGCLRWQRDGLTAPTCVKQATEEYRAEEDVIGQFISERTKRADGGRILMSSLYQAYQDWAAENGIRFALTARAFNKKLEERGLNRTKSNGAKYWEGWALTN
jgi:P4 family phage/plasmid primase-like protien